MYKRQGELLAVLVVRHVEPDGLQAGEDQVAALLRAGYVVPAQGAYLRCGGAAGAEHGRYCAGLGYGFRLE